MSLDTIGGFGGNNSPKQYFHLLTDHFSRFSYSSCSSGQSARDFIALVDSVHSVNRIEILLTDQYGGLSSDEFASYCESAGIKHVFVAVDCAFSNGLNERTGQTLVNRIRCARNDSSALSKNKKVAWTTLASKCVSDYNATPHSVTGFSPSYLLSGESSDIVPNGFRVPSSLSADRVLALENTIKNHNYNKKRYDCFRIEGTFNVKDNVFIDNGNKLNRAKMDPVRIGPYVISKRLSNHIYEIYLGKNKRFPRRLYHVSKILSV